MIKPTFLFVSLFFLTAIGVNAQFNAENISLHSIWKDSSLTHSSNLEANYNSVWGYYDAVKNKEYAILGGKDGTYFVDVTSPSNPVLCDYVPGRRNNCTWREYKNYGKYVYMISDDAPPNSFQIADMSYLPDSVHVIYDSDALIKTAHTLYIDKNNLYCASVVSFGGNHSSLSVYDLSNPENPAFLRSLGQDDNSFGSVHDMFVRNDTVYVSAGFDKFHVYNFLANNTFNKLGSITSYPDAGYNHSSWLADDGKTLVFCDEVPENLAVKVLDVSDLSDIKVLSFFKSNEGATAHNPYIIGNKVVISYYEDGVQIYDLSNPESPVRSGFFDTHPQNGNIYNPMNPYNGCWGAYPYLPSGILLASDRQNGLFVLNADFALNTPEVRKNVDVKISPNPFVNNINIQLPVNRGNYNLSVFDLTGRTIYYKNINLQGSNNFDISFEKEIPAGVYFLKIYGEDIEQTEKIVKY
ncbi:MAG: choice-of-anchor B family protein [Bacteroidota bacterium]|nr:choice-of-anchor B family protein [Bacteroidota bacterium]